MASVDNVKRTWVNYGLSRDWTDAQQGQVRVYTFALISSPFIV